MEQAENCKWIVRKIAEELKLVAGATAEDDGGSIGTVRELGTNRLLLAFKVYDVHIAQFILEGFLEGEQECRQ